MAGRKDMVNTATGLPVVRVGTLPPTAASDDAHRPRYALVVMSERAPATTHTLPDEGQVTVGRAPDSTLRIDDARLSRTHAVIRRAGDGYEIADCGSSNGTFIGERRVGPARPHRLSVGDVIRVGSTSVVFQYAAPGGRPRRIQSHAYFEARVEEECLRAGDAPRPFAVARVRVARGSDEGVVERVLVEAVRPTDVLASYGPDEHEALFIETTPALAHAFRGDIEHRLEAAGVPATVAVACYPRDGRTPEALLAATAPPPSSSAASVPRLLAGAATRPLLALVDKVAPSDISVLLLGETGVGKEVLARAIHERSPRSSRPMVCLNCAALSESLLESELFGHEKGAFTGAVATKIGLLESASGGTAFLDEVGEMPLGLQAKLLRVIEQREVMRVGAVKPRPIDVRFVSATNRDLALEVERGHFRQDLYFRLAAFSIAIPPLRQRVDEIEPLARQFVAAACARAGRPPLDIAPDALAALLAYDWPGNIRELKNVMDRAVLLSSGSTIELVHVARDQVGRILRSPSQPAPERPRSAPPQDFESATRVALPADDERSRIVEALEQCAGNQTQAAKLLGISRRTLVTRLGAHGLPRPRKRQDG